MNPDGLSPYVRVAMYSVVHNTDTIVSERIIFDHELIFIESGRWLLLYDGAEYICCEGDFILLAPGVRHSMHAIDGMPVSQPHIHFDVTYDSFSEKIYVSFKDLQQFTKSERAMIRDEVFCMPSPILGVADTDGLKLLMFEVIDIFNGGGAFAKIDCKINMLKILKIIIGESLVSEPDSTRRENTAVRSVKEYINYNFSGRLTLDMLEQRFHYSKFYISKNFKAQYGVSVMQYYNSLRLEHAKALLGEGKTVSETAAALSFGSIYTFSRFFKSAVGVPPSVYGG